MASPAIAARRISRADTPDASPDEPAGRCADGRDVGVEVLANEVRLGEDSCPGRFVERPQCRPQGEHRDAMPSSWPTTGMKPGTRSTGDARYAGRGDDPCPSGLRHARLAGEQPGEAQVARRPFLIDRAEPGPTGTGPGRAASLSGSVGQPSRTRPSCAIRPPRPAPASRSRRPGMSWALRQLGCGLGTRVGLGRRGVRPIAARRVTGRLTIIPTPRTTQARPPRPPGHADRVGDGVAVGDEAFFDGPRDGLPEQPLDAAQQVGLVDADEADGVAVGARSGRPADPMDVVLGSNGSSKLMTCGSSSMSSPRAATSVATRMRTSPALEHLERPAALGLVAIAVDALSPRCRAGQATRRAAGARSSSG